MSFPPQPTPAALLASRDWRLRNSWWLLPVILGCGMFTWAGFLYIWVVTKNRAWLVATAAYIAAFVGIIVLIELAGPRDSEVAAGAVRTATQQTLTEWSGGVIIAVWFFGIVHAFLVRPQFLRKRAENAAPWWATNMSVIHPQFGSGHHYPPPVSQGYGPPPLSLHKPGGPEQYWAPPTAPPPNPPAPPVPPAPTPTRVNVNSASEAELLGIGLNSQAVDGVLAARGRHGGLSSVQEFAEAAGLKPHELHGITELVEFDDPQQAPPPQQTFRPGGRRLDL